MLPNGQPFSAQRSFRSTTYCTIDTDSDGNEVDEGATASSAADSGDSGAVEDIMQWRGDLSADP